MAAPYHLAIFDLPGVLLPGPASALAEAAPSLRTAQALRKLANRVPIGLLAPCEEAALKRIAERLGAPVSLRLSSCAADGTERPWPDVFAELLRRLRVPPERLLHVSNVGRVLRAAGKHGLSLAWVASAAGPRGLEPRHRAADLAALVDQVLALPEPEVPFDRELAALYGQTYVRGVHLFNAGDYYRAHEAWEHCWKSGPAAEGDFYRGLIQVAAALLHGQRGNAAGARSLLAEGRGRLLAYLPRHRGLELSAFLRDLDGYLRHQLSTGAGGAEPPAGPPQIALEP